MCYAFELATTEQGAVEGIEPILWTTDGSSSSSTRVDIDPWLSLLGDVPGPAIDLVRIAFGALVADRRSPRRAGWSRSIHLRIRVVELAAWKDGVEALTRILGFLTGDDWSLELVPDDAEREAEPQHVEPASRAILFSGGLDSFAGAVVGLADALRGDNGPSPIFVSQRDNSFVGHAQNEVSGWLRDNCDSNFAPATVWLAQGQKVRESSSRSRSLLFASLGIAAALARGARSAEMPENGFTSLNPPLRINRGGALSTRSTHPTTFLLLNNLLELIGLDIRVSNPHEWLTKGELVAQGAALSTGDFPEGCSRTLSCGKLDGARYSGGNGNLNCGLCVNCLVRRAAIVAAGVEDRTEYLVGRLAGEALARLKRNRSGDLQAVKAVISSEFDEDTLVGSAPYPPGFDVDRAVEVYRRGLAELRNLDVW